jgi:hypothetical protein
VCGCVNGREWRRTTLTARCCVPSNPSSQAAAVAGVCMTTSLQRLRLDPSTCTARRSGRSPMTATRRHPLFGWDPPGLRASLCDSRGTGAVVAKRTHKPLVPILPQLSRGWTLRSKGTLPPELHAIERQGGSVSERVGPALLVLLHACSLQQGRSPTNRGGEGRSVYCCCGCCCCLLRLLCGVCVTTTLQRLRLDPSTGRARRSVLFLPGFALWAPPSLCASPYDSWGTVAVVANRPPCSPLGAPLPQLNRVTPG